MPRRPRVAASGQAQVLIAEEDMKCEVCGHIILVGTLFVRAAYGPVHDDPCSHQGKQTA